MLKLEEGCETTIQLSLRACSSNQDSWNEFVIFSMSEETEVEHCRGLISIGVFAREGMHQHELVMASRDSY